MKTLTIDPSGTGTSGFFLTDGTTYEFTQFNNPLWKEHLKFIMNYIKEKQPTQIIYENSNFIHNRTASAVSLFELFGAIEMLIYIFPKLNQIAHVSASQVKRFYTQLYENKVQIPNLNYKVGRGNGWTYDGQRLSRHQIDAFLIYYIHENRAKPKRS